MNVLTRVNEFTTYGVRCVKDARTQIRNTMTDTAGEALQFAKRGVVTKTLENGR